MIYSIKIVIKDALSLQLIILYVTDVAEPYLNLFDKING